jgi:hypothetical protein
VKFARAAGVRISEKSLTAIQMEITQAGVKVQAKGREPLGIGSRFWRRVFFVCIRSSVNQRDNGREEIEIQL